MNKLSKIILGIIIAMVILAGGVFFIYKGYFAPKTPVTPITKQVNISTKYLIKKFLPNNFNLSLKEVFVESDTTFSEEELTDIFVYGLNEIPEIKEYITGLKVEILDNKIVIYIQGEFKSIPLEGKMIFTANAENGKGVFHYEEGNIGFIDIKKEWIFRDAVPTSVLDFDKENGNIILNFKAIRELEVRKVSVSEKGLNLVFRGTIKFWE